MQVRGILVWTLAAWLVATGAPALSVAGPAMKKCSLDTQTCLDQMVSKLSERGWLGIEYDNSSGDDFMKLTRVVPGSPAEAAGFRVGDVMISLNGAKFSDNTEERCATCAVMKDAWKPGATVKYVVLRDGEEIVLTPTLATLPSDVMAMMIGMHMMEHANPSPEHDAPRP